MALVEPQAGSDPTHRVVVRQPSGVRDVDETGRIAVENRVVDVAMEYGRSVHLSVDCDRVRADETPLVVVVERFDRCPESQRRLANPEPEYRASLPRDAAAVRSALAVAPDDTDAWHHRVFTLHEFAVLTDESWLYRSVPHHAHIREVNAAASDELLERLREALASVPRAGIVPIDGLVSWESNGITYELHWDSLRRSAGGDRWTVFELDRLRHVAPIDDTTLALRWAPASAESWPRHVVRYLLDRRSRNPPNRLAVPDRSTATEVLEAFERCSEQFAYPYAVESTEDRRSF